MSAYVPRVCFLPGGGAQHRENQLQCSIMIHLSEPLAAAVMQPTILAGSLGSICTYSRQPPPDAHTPCLLKEDLVGHQRQMHKVGHWDNVLEDEKLLVSLLRSRPP